LKDDKYVQEIKQCIKDTIQYTRNNITNENIEDEHLELTIDDQLFFEMIKLQIRGKTIGYSAAKKKENQNIEKDLEK
jgi:hypothetical protein